MWGPAALIGSPSESFPPGLLVGFSTGCVPHDCRTGQIDSTLPGVTAALQLRDGLISSIGGTVGVICRIPNQVNMLAPIAAIKWHGWASRIGGCLNWAV